MTTAPEALLVGDDAAIPKDRYLSQGFLDLELDRLWGHVWQIAGREEELNQAGDHLEYTIGEQSVIVMRGDEGALHAFHNVCLHRGTRLLSGVGSLDAPEILFLRMTADDETPRVWHQRERLKKDVHSFPGVEVA